MENPKRRQFLQMTCVAGTIGLTGCQRSLSGPNDADGDGVVDSEDAAPQNPDAQREEQIESNSAPADTEISETPVIKLNDELPSGFKNGGAVRQSTDVIAGGRGDYAWKFDGESYIQTDYTWGESDHSGTLSSWVYVSSSDANISAPRYLLSTYDSSAQVGEFDTLSLMQDPDAGIGIQKTRDGNEDNIAEAFASSYPTDQWFHLTGVVDKDVNEVQVYINGEQRDVGSDLEITIEHGTEFGIGAQTEGGSGSYQYNGNFTGKLDDVRIYDVAP